MPAKHTLESMDKKIADIIALIVFYESINLALIALHDAQVPQGHASLLSSLLTQGKTTFKKDANKSILKTIATLVNPKAKEAVDRKHFLSSVVQEIRTVKASFDEAVASRRAMEKVVTGAKVDAIIKSGAKKTTVAKARAHVKKQAAKHGLLDNDEIQEYLDME